MREERVWTVDVQPEPGFAVIVGPQRLKRPRNAAPGGTIKGPKGSGVSGIGPTDQELRHCLWGWLLALAYCAQIGEMPDPAYVAEVARYYGLPVPVMVPSKADA